MYAVMYCIGINSADKRVAEYQSIWEKTKEWVLNFKYRDLVVAEKRLVLLLSA